MICEKEYRCISLQLTFILFLGIKWGESGWWGDFRVFFLREWKFRFQDYPKLNCSLCIDSGYVRNVIGSTPYQAWLDSLPGLAEFPTTSGWIPYHPWLYSLPGLAEFPTRTGCIPYQDWLNSLPLLAVFPTTLATFPTTHWLYTLPLKEGRERELIPNLVRVTKE